ncbi:MAG: hypothetical protein EXS59_02090 [Candidatus Taylorbacteria bacterium]|nr:hypothetical protein [Candidatus Taylorbacteria bacterium]
MKKIELKVVVVSHPTGWYAEPLYSGDVKTMHLDSTEKIVRACTLVMEDADGMGTNYYRPAATYEAVTGLDEIYNHPHVHDLLMSFFLKGFQEGMKHQAEQGVKPAGGPQ